MENIFKISSYDGRTVKGIVLSDSLAFFFPYKQEGLGNLEVRRSYEIKDEAGYTHHLQLEDGNPGGYPKTGDIVEMSPDKTLLRILARNNGSSLLLPASALRETVGIAFPPATFRFDRLR